MRGIIILPLLLAGCFMYSCGGGARKSSVMDGDELYTPRYAKGFVVEDLDGGRLLKITDPWQGAEGYVQQIFVADSGRFAPEGFDGVVIDLPLSAVACMSSTYIAFIDALGCVDAIKAVSGAKYVTNTFVRNAYARGEIAEAGYDTSVQYETIAASGAKVVFAYGVTGEDPVMASKLALFGTDLIYIGDYVEASPLGKAEWLVAFGYMFGQEETALELFGQIEERYLSLMDGVKSGDKPMVMLNSPYRDTWFVPGDRSYMVRLIEDAGGSYACAGEDSETSRPISLESAYVKMLEADIWLNPGQAVSMNDVLVENPRFAAMPPVTTGRVYNCNKRMTPEGGSDFWESGALRPDIVLEDMINIFHGDGADEDLYYFRKLE